MLLAETLPELAVQVPTLKIVGGCGYCDDFCASFYTQPKPNGASVPWNHPALSLRC
jgi:hypothetical protein